MGPIWGPSGADTKKIAEHLCRYLVFFAVFLWPKFTIDGVMSSLENVFNHSGGIWYVSKKNTHNSCWHLFNWLIAKYDLAWIFPECDNHKAMSQNYAYFRKRSTNSNLFSLFAKPLITENCPLLWGTGCRHNISMCGMSIMTGNPYAANTVYLYWDGPRYLFRKEEQ